MSKLDILYYNINLKKNLKVLKNNSKIITRTENLLENLESINILDNNELLNDTINLVNKFKGKKKYFVLLGTGGSNLGARALVNILQGSEKTNIIFFDNIDPIGFQNSINKIDLNKAGYIVISKSGSTPETLSQFSSLIEIFERKNNINKLFRNTLIITEEKESPLLKIGRANKCTIIKHNPKIGGRYSIFSNVGMVPAIIAGLDVKKIHAGALSFVNNNNTEYLKIGKIFYNQNFNSKLTNSVLMTYSDALFYYGKWYLQLWAESIGKNNKGITAIHSVGTTDQHSQLQLYLDGPRDKFFTFITTNHGQKGLKLNKNTMKKYGVDYLVNKKMGDLMQAEQQATLDTFKKNKLPFRVINLPVINEFSMGQIMALGIMETIASCLFYGVDPFNQPAVEQGKILTKKYLS